MAKMDEIESIDRKRKLVSGSVIVMVGGIVALGALLPWFNWGQVQYPAMLLWIIGGLKLTVVLYEIYKASPSSLPKQSFMVADGDEWPARMYLKNEAGHTRLYNLHERAYFTYWCRPLSVKNEVASSLIASMTQGGNGGNWWPVTYEFIQDQTGAHYTIYKKQGFKANFVIYNDEDQKVFEILQEKKKEFQLLLYKGNDLRWQANSGGDLDYISVDTPDGITALKLKRDGIPLENPRPFERYSGYLIDRYINGRMEDELLLFLSVLDALYRVRKQY
ncbi:hypothetical protein N781_13600 [Pontibacillus halophilus JSM 076056 = DSM 19796]|uniref:Uncharacterized protein n=1 Tax=Pontibacillus halophilus JSM 076056 = DSM 19796 TaxID=1385510 RepID=A0A0A5GPA0_9BACI|nr:hypothetical protein [Pontibacillus halophilus]KGX93048.1 hypothetical protein N781_13600 [Pontibacillus halophilus JSM 076056 = DSM 19796]